jgi:predicted extracellular nuclease
MSTIQAQPAITPIQDIQGSGLVSPEEGNVHTVEGIVVGDFQQGNELKGFFVQEEDADSDADPATSEGIFVFAPSSPDVNVGDLVRVAGKVDEFFDLTELTGITSITVISSDNTLPTAATVTLPFTTASDLEQYEGMLVTFPQTLTVTENFNLGRFGEVGLSSGGRLLNPTNIVDPGSAALARQAANDLNRILLDDGMTEQNPVPIIHPDPGLSAVNTLRAGDTITGLTGVMHFGFGEYRVQPTSTPAFISANPRTVSPADVGGSLKVASFNLLNYFTTIDSGASVCSPGVDQDCRGADSISERIRQRKKIIAALSAIDADIVGLIELENDAASAAIQDLVNGLNAVTGVGTYGFVNTGPIRTDVIRVAFIYKSATVSPVGSFAILDSSVDPTFLDTKNRSALAQTFEEISTGEKVTVAVNHFKSKGALELDDPNTTCGIDIDPNIELNCDQFDGQGYWNKARTDAATAVVNWLATDPTDSGDPDFLIVGDLNAYAKEDPIKAMTNAGYTNLLETFVGAGAYSFIFFGQAGSLNHALSSPTLTAQVTGVTEWHINADEPRVLDYNEEFKSSGQIISLYNAEPYRSSDHDPVIVGLNLITSAPPLPPPPDDPV